MNLENAVNQALYKYFDHCDQLSFQDDRGDGHHFSLTVISDKFTGMNRLERHRLVQKILSDFIQTDKIHALRMRLKTYNEQ